MFRVDAAANHFAFSDCCHSFCQKIVVSPEGPSKLWPTLAMLLRTAPFR